MTAKQKLELQGLYTYQDKYSDTPSGALNIANNIVIDKDSIASSRPGFSKLLPDYGEITSINEFEGVLLAHSYEKSKLYSLTLGQDSILTSSTFTTDMPNFNSNIVRFAKQSKNVYMNSSKGIMKLDTITGDIIPAGAPRAKFLELSLVTVTGVGIINNGEERAYRLVWGYKDVNNNLILGYPSERAVIVDISSGAKDIQFKSSLPAQVNSTTWFYQLYRTKKASLNESGDEMGLVLESQVTSEDILKGYIEYPDITEDSLMGASLYTNDTQEGIARGNTQPPACVDLVSYQNHMFYANTQLKASISFSLLGSLTSGDTISIKINDGTPIVLEGVSGSPINDNEFQIDDGITDAQLIDSTARGIVRCISKVAPGISGFYASGYTDLPGKILIEVDDSETTFSITYIPLSSGDPKFYPDMSEELEAEVETKPNRVYFSKLQEPEAVPLIHYLDVGSSDDAIVALAALRDRIIVIKEQSVHRITGTDVNSFATQLVDNTVQISDIRTVVNLSNRVFALSNQGIVAISDSVQLLSRKVNDIVRGPFTKVHATALEKEGLYLLTCSTSTDYYTIVYNSINNLFTTWKLNYSTIFSYTYKDRLIFGKDCDEISTDSLLVQRNTLTSLDYADEFYATLPTLDGAIFTFNESDFAELEVGSVLVQRETSEGTEYGKVLISELDEGTLTATVRYLAKPEPGIEEWFAYKTIKTEIEFWPIVGKGISEYKDFNEVSLIYDVQLLGTVDVSFKTDLNPIEELISFSSVTETAGWGLFSWGMIPWGQTPDLTRTLVKRILVPLKVSMGHELIINIKTSTSNQQWEFSGISIKYQDVDFTPMTI